MGDVDLVTAEDVRLMQGLAQRVTAVRPDLVNSDATFGELAWIWGKGTPRTAGPGHVASGSPAASWWRGAGPTCRVRCGAAMDR
jgi:hypothetical protein